MGNRPNTAKIRLKGHKPVFKTFDRLTDARDWAAKTETEIKVENTAAQVNNRLRPFFNFFQQSPPYGIATQI
jgi:hypothetical protein